MGLSEEHYNKMVAEDPNFCNTITRMGIKNYDEFRMVEENLGKKTTFLKTLRVTMVEELLTKIIEAARAWNGYKYISMSPRYDYDHDLKEYKYSGYCMVMVHKDMPTESQGHGGRFNGWGDKKNRKDKYLFRCTWTDICAKGFVIRKRRDMTPDNLEVVAGCLPTELTVNLGHTQPPKANTAEANDIVPAMKKAIHEHDANRSAGMVIGHSGTGLSASAQLAAAHLHDKMPPVIVAEPANVKHGSLNELMDTVATAQLRGNKHAVNAIDDVAFLDDSITEASKDSH